MARGRYLLGLLLIASTALATETPLAKLSLEDLSDVTVTTASKSPQKVSDAPATMYTFSATEIARRGYRNVIELLQGIPEVEINAKGFVEAYNLVTVRGISGIEKNFLILQDGIRINAIAGSPTATHWNYPLHQAKRVEVIIGPASALYGEDAILGIINIITKNADDLDGGEATLSAGLESTTDDSFIYGKKFGDVSVVLNGSFYRSSEPDFPSLYPSEYSWYNTQYSLTGRMPKSGGGTIALPIHPYATPTNAYTFGGKIDLGDFELGYWRNFESHSSSTGARSTEYLYVDAAKLETVVETLYGRYTYRPPGQPWSLKTEISKGKQVLQPDSAYVATAVDYNDGFIYYDDENVTVLEEVSYPISSAEKLIAGFEYQDYSVLPRVSGGIEQFNPRVGTGSQNQTYYGTNLNLDYYSLFYQNYGAYAQLQSKLADHFELTSGIRFDDNTRYGTTFNPRVGAVYEINPRIKTKLLYGEAYEAPPPWLEYANVGSFTVSGGVPTGGRFAAVPNPNLQPEKLRTLEGSAVYKISDRLFLTTDIYANIVTNLFFSRQPLPAGYTFHGVPITGSYVVNKGTLHSQGATVQADAQSEFGKTRINSYAAYSFLRGDIDGGPLVNAASSTVKGGVDAIRGKFTLSPQMEFRSRSMIPNTDLSTPSYVVFNLAARYENVFGTEGFKTSVFMNIRNLLDRRYFNANVDNTMFLGQTPEDPIRGEIGATMDF